MNNFKELEEMAKIYDGWVLAGCLKDSPGERAGLKAGDIILTINDKKINSLAAFVEACNDGSTERYVQFIRFGIRFVTRVCIDDVTVTAPSQMTYDPNIN